MINTKAKLRNNYLVFVLFIVFSQSVYSQKVLDITLSTGVSELIKSRPDPSLFDPDNSKINSIPTILIDLSRTEKTKHINFHYGIRTVSGVGAQHSFFGRWSGLFSGLKLGLSKTTNKLSFGININPTIRLYGLPTIQGYGRQIDGRLIPIYNVECNPNLSYSILENKLDVVLDYSIGITPIYKSLFTNNYRAHYLSWGLKYSI